MGRVTFEVWDRGRERDMRENDQIKIVKRNKSNQTGIIQS